MSDQASDPSGQQLYLLGQIHAMVQSLKDGQEVTNSRLDKMDERLRTVEQRSAAVGALSGGAMAIGVTLIAEQLKDWLRRGGHP